VETIYLALLVQRQQSMNKFFDNHHVLWLTWVLSPDWSTGGPIWGRIAQRGDPITVWFICCLATFRISLGKYCTEQLNIFCLAVQIWLKKDWAYPSNIVANPPGQSQISEVCPCPDPAGCLSGNGRSINTIILLNIALWFASWLSEESAPCGEHTITTPLTGHHKCVQ